MARWAFQDLDRVWRFDVPPEVFWGVVSRTDEYETWWRWLRHFDATDGLNAGSVLDATVQMGMPIGLHLGVEVLEMEPETWISYRVWGDVEGSATTAMSSTPAGGCDVHVRASLEIVRASLARVLRVTGPVADWVLETCLRIGLQGFNRRLSELELELA